MIELVISFFLIMTILLFWAIYNVVKQVLNNKEDQAKKYDSPPKYSDNNLFSTKP